MSALSERWARFWSHVRKSRLPDGCWRWTGTISSEGYGRQGDHYAHRLSWELHFGPIPEGMWVLHRCDVRSCVRPGHLFLGTVLDNQRDMAAKGRHGRYNARKTHCPRRHRYAGANLLVSSGRRRCRACDRLRKGRRYVA